VRECGSRYVSRGVSFFFAYSFLLYLPVLRELNFTAMIQGALVKTDLYRDGMAHLDRGEVEEGLRLLEAAWSASPDSVEVMHGLARALELAGERLQAVELLERAHAIAPSEPGPACDLAMLYLERAQA
jgi:Flp pilus assembly protein TadD